MNDNFKLLVAALGLSVGLSGHAQAMTTDIGTLTAPTSMAHVILKPVGPFSDTWIFDIVGTPLWAGGSVSNLSISLSPLLTLYNIDSLSVKLFNASHTLIQDLDLNPGSSANIKVGSGTFPVGNDYYLTISGNASGMFGGQYVFAVTTLPVPETETWAMLLAGLGLVGLQLRRKSKMAKEIAVN